MALQRDQSGQPDPFDTGLPRAESGEEVPRWLLILGLVAGLTLLVALLRYAIDLLGVVFVIILVGFAIRALSDWLTEGESVSGWAMSAVSLGLMGTALVGLWLFSSRDVTSQALQERLPGPMQRTVGWLEERGWGQRVLLPASPAPGASAQGGGAPTGPGSAAAPAPAPSSAPVVMTRSPRVTPSLPSGGGAAPSPRRRAAAPPDRTGDAEAAPAAAQSAATPTAAAAPSAPAAAPTLVALQASPSRPVVGRSVRLTAQVRGGGGQPAPSGTVTFFADGAELGRARLRDGTAVLTTLDLGLGDHTLSVAYEGDATFLPSRSGSLSLTVARK